VPAAVVVTAVFENLAHTAARAQGYPSMRLLVLPHPMESKPEAEVRAIARARADTLLGLLTAGRGH
jgi:hypothetical protein